MPQDKDDDDVIIAKQSEKQTHVFLLNTGICLQMVLLVLMSTNYNSKIIN